MNWDQTMVTCAANEGWQLTTIIDNGTTHPYYAITRSPQSGHASDGEAMRMVFEMAKRNSPLHKHALHLMTASRVKPQAKAKRK